MPKPRTLRYTPCLRWSSMSRVSSPSLLTPTLKSPSVHRMTRLMPPERNDARASWYARSMPAAPLVDPPDSSAASAARIVGLVRARGGRKRDALGAGVDHDRDLIFRSELIDHQAHRLLQQWQLVRIGHRARHVEEEHQVARWHVGVGDGARAQRDPEHLHAGVPRARAQLGVHRERRGAGRQRIGVAEIVEQLLGADGVGRRTRALAHEAAEVGVRRGVDVDRERRQRRGGDGEERVVAQAGVGLGAERLVDRRGDEGAADHGGADERVVDRGRARERDARGRTLAASRGAEHRAERAAGRDVLGVVGGDRDAGVRAARIDHRRARDDLDHLRRRRDDELDLRER
jgi:hypothetical protein